MKHLWIAAFSAVVLFSPEAAAQHDAERNLVIKLEADGPEATLADMNMTKGRRRRGRSTGASQKLFVQAMIACRAGDANEAFKHAKAALAGGVPLQRFLSGPRGLFVPLYDHPEFKVLVEKLKSPLLQGPMLGSVTDGSAAFWVRTLDESDVRIEVEDAEGGKSLAGTARSSSKADYTAVVTVKGLRPDTRYIYKLLIDGREAGGPFAFRTFPKEGAPAVFRVAFGGGAGYVPEYEQMWSTIAKREPLALLMLGDNVYIDDPEHPVTHHFCYKRRQSQPDWQKLTAGTSVAAIYDDHDFGNNDCVPGPEVDDPPWKRKVWEVFTQNWNNPAYGGGKEEPGCWFDFYVGDVHFIILDCRYYRDLKGGTMLGPVQKKWLLETLDNSKGRFKVLASSVPWSPGVKPKSKDTWDGFPKERESIFSFIEEHKIEGVLLMAADRHRSDLRQIMRPNGYDLYEVMSSRLTNVHTHGLMEKAKGSRFIMGYNGKCSFGLLEFDTTAGDPEVRYTIVNIDNETIDSRTLKSSQLSFSTQDNAKQESSK
jgi:alkaline phosphatase D